MNDLKMIRQQEKISQIEDEELIKEEMRDNFDEPIKSGQTLMKENPQFIKSKLNFKTSAFSDLEKRARPHGVQQTTKGLSRGTTYFNPFMITNDQASKIQKIKCLN